MDVQQSKRWKDHRPHRDPHEVDLNFPGGFGRFHCAGLWDWSTNWVTRHVTCVLNLHVLRCMNIYLCLWYHPKGRVQDLHFGICQNARTAMLRSADWHWVTQSSTGPQGWVGCNFCLLKQNCICIFTRLLNCWWKKNCTQPWYCFIHLRWRRSSSINSNTKYM